MSDLIERLRGTKLINDPFPAVFWGMTQEAADALEARDKRIAELQAKVEALECVLMEIRQAAEDNNLMPDYIIALTMVAATEQKSYEWVDDVGWAIATEQDRSVEALEAARSNWYCEMCGCPRCLEAEAATEQEQGHE